jgi:hypothetical protein
MIPRRFLSETHEIWTGDAVMVSYLVPPHPGKETLYVIRVGLSLVAEAMGFLMVYPAQREPRVERIPRGGFIGAERRPRNDPLVNAGERVNFVAEDTR